MIYFVTYETIKFNLLYPQMIGFKISFSQKKKKLLFNRDDKKNNSRDCE